MASMKLLICVIAVAAFLALGELGGNASPDDDCKVTGKCPDKKFDDLLQSALLEMGLHKLNHTTNTSGKQLQIPMTTTLFIAGRGAGASKLGSAIQMMKMPDANKFYITAHLRKGNIVFLPSKSTWNNAYNIDEASMVRETEFCDYCGLDAHLRMSGEPGAVEIPGPARRGIMKVVVDLDAGTVSYHCGDKCWKHKKLKGDDLWAVGPNICDGDDPNTEGNWENQVGPKLVKDADAMIWRATLHMCPSKRGFKIYRKPGKNKDDAGLWAGSIKSEATENIIGNWHGHLKQFKDASIPGPDVEAYMSLVVDWDAGTFSLTCVDQCNGPQMKDYNRFQASNPVNGPGEAFVHLFSWRWTDVAIECEQWLGPKGVKAVQVAPPQESKVPKPGKHDSWNYNYRPVSYKLESRMGTEAQLKDMINRCRAAGVDVYIDAVINHFAGGGGMGSAGTRIYSRSFPETGLTPEDFHHNPGDSSSNCRVEKKCDHHCDVFCDFNGMPDLDTSSPKVQGIIAEYLNRVLDLGVAGFRIDAADHISAPDLSQIMSNVQPKWRFSESHHWKDKLAFSAVTQFKYKNQLAEALFEGEIAKLRLIGEGTSLAPSQDAVVFTVNHDGVMKAEEKGSGVIYKQPTLYTLANVVMLALPYGYPKVTSSFFFPDGAPDYYAMPALAVHGDDGSLRCGDGVNWVCEHRWPAIANMFNWRKSAGSESITSWTLLSDTQAYFCRGPNACIIINGALEQLALSPTLTLPEGDYCNVIVSDDPSQCPLTKVNGDGTTAGQVLVPPTSTVAFHVRSKASASLL